MHRFFVAPDCISGDRVALDGSVARQLARVLRHRPGDQIVVLDDTGFEHIVRLDSVDARAASGVITDRIPSRAEPRVALTLYQGVLKADRFELVLQKGTELGVSRFVPTNCARSVRRMTPSSPGESRIGRWRRIIVEAAEQSGRGRLPVLSRPLDFADACDQVAGLALMPWEQEREVGLRAALERWKRDGDRSGEVSVLVGPEGGFTEEEVEHARSRGITSVSLGGRILRAETAGIAATTAVLYELGELGG